jgi:copper(I)-binding protein
MRILVATALALTASAALAAPPAETLRVENAWARPAAKGQNTAAYLTIVNAGSSADVLKAVETPLGKASLHQSSMSGGVARMRPMDQGLRAPARRTVVLAPGGDHIMLSGLVRALAPGQKIPATLVFQHAGRVKIAISVETKPPSAQNGANNIHR